MTLHSYSRCWIHLVWATLNREKLLARQARTQVSQYLYNYAKSKSIPMEVNFVNADHVHALIDLPSGKTIEEVMKFLKGASSHWINQERITPAKFSWGRGYGAFSVSQSQVGESSNTSEGRRSIIVPDHSARSTPASSVHTRCMKSRKTAEAVKKSGANLYHLVKTRC